MTTSLAGLIERLEAETGPVSVPIFTVGVLHAIAEIPDSKGGK